ncbi:MAG: glycosyltransferase family 2 protein [Bacteroidales bacterium]|nr:glycosyltransferase family 2 protein [Bacteroidales bacterium]
MEKQCSLVSVIVPCFNMERFIADTLNSVINQTFSNWELYIVDDNSSDDTIKIIQAFCEKDSRIHFTTQIQHEGIANARNQCIQMAQGRFLAFLDADDLWHPDKLQRQLKFMTERNIGFSYTSYDCVDESGKPLNKTIKTAGDLNYKSYLRNTIIGCSTVMIDTEIIGQVNVPDFRTSEDTATWLNILKKGFKAYAITEPLTSYRIRSKSASSNKLKASADLWRVYRQQEKLPLFNALYSFSCYVFNAIKKRICS